MLIVLLNIRNQNNGNVKIHKDFKYRPNLILIPSTYQNPPSPNEYQSKGYRIGDIKASAHASHKTHACISLKQRGNSRNYGLVYNLGKQMAVLSD